MARICGTVTVAVARLRAAAALRLVWFGIVWDGLGYQENGKDLERETCAREESPRRGLAMANRGGCGIR
jgi:hypothetical protein